ncbi:MAG: hypothetical protein O3A14_19720 [Cyanobacteria bacterium]|nr:hypothetical protein [Cyanobacteriota bacterium]
MSSTRLSPIAFSVRTLLLAISLFLASPRPTLACPLSHSLYRDSSGQDFELTWQAPIRDRASSQATLQIRHGDDLLYHLDLTQASGYGTIFLRLLDPSRELQGDPLTLNFFDETLADANPLFFELAQPAPTYVFIPGLGSYDYYQRRGEGPLLGEVMWIFERCQTADSTQ